MMGYQGSHDDVYDDGHDDAYVEGHRAVGMS